MAYLVVPDPAWVLEVPKKDAWNVESMRAPFSIADQLTGTGTLSRPLGLCVHLCTLGQPGSRAVRSRCGRTASAPSQMSLGPSQVVNLLPKAEEP